MAPPFILHEDARSEHVLAVPDHGAVVVDRAAGGHVFMSERHTEIEVEVAVFRGDPGYVQPIRSLTSSIR
jgi:hypothetical protein